MASPFNVFRRNQRAMIAIAGVVCMFVFVLGDPITRYLGHAGATTNPVVVKANSHSYRASELMALIQSRQTVRNFLQRLAVDWAQKEVEAGHVPSRDATAFIEATFEKWHQELMQRFVPPDEMPADDDAAPRALGLSQDEAEAIQTVVLASAAEQQGMVVTDQGVNDYLQMVTRNLISPSEFEKIVASLHGDTRNMSQAYLFDALRRELLASRYSFMYQVSLASVLPAPRWEYFQELNRRAKSQVFAVPVERFVKDAPEPSDAELKAFFEKYSKTLPVPNSPTPGFKRPARAMFQYFVAKFSDFSDRAMAQVTPEEMHDYYEKNKDIRYRERPPQPGTDADDAKPDDAKPADAKPADAKPAGAKPTETKPADDGKKSSRSVPASALHLVAQAQKPGAKTPPAKTPAAAPAATPPAAATPPVATPPAATPPPATTPSTATPAATGADEKPAADSTDGKSGGTEAASAEAGADDKTNSKKDVKYEPFEKVEDEIRKTLAGEKANKNIEDIFQRLSTKMREYSSARSVYEANKEEDSNLEPPESLDLPALASAEGLEVHETTMVSADEALEDTDLGKSFSFILDRRSPFGYREVPFTAIGFPERLFRPISTDDRNGDRYLSWKVKETPEGVPDFDEVRKEVVRALKLIEARKLAVAAAEQYAKEARTAGKPLAEVFAGREGLEVVETGPFSWMTIGSVAFDPNANQPHLSEVHGVQSPGEEFMEAVFNSTPDQIRVAMNEPKTAAYVIQVQGFEPPRDDLRQEFLLEDFRKYARLAMNDEQVGYVQWIRWLDRQAGVTWLEPGYTNRRGGD